MNRTAELFNESIEATPNDIKQRVEWSFEIADKIDAKGICSQGWAFRG